MRFLIFALTLFLVIPVSSQERILNGHLNYNIEYDTMYNGTYQIFPRTVFIDIYQENKIVAYSFCDSTGVFPIVLLHKNQINDSLKLDSIAKNISPYMLLKPITPGVYDLVFRHNGYITKVLKNITLDFNTPKEFNVIFPDFIPLEYIELYNTYRNTNNVMTLKFKPCPLGHNDDVIPICYGLEKKGNGFSYPVSCFSGIATTCWRCNKHNFEY